MIAHRLALLCALVGLFPAGVQAHEVRPGYLQLREIDSRNYDVLFKVPAKADRRLELFARLPESCRGTEPTARFSRGAYIERWAATCDRGLVGHRVEIAGLAATRTDVLVRVERADATTQTLRLTPDAPAFIVTAAEGSAELARTYLLLGTEHILLGVDHLLFVLALLFLVGSWPRLLGTVTAFTAAHSLTLAAATLGWIHVPQAPVEAVIALSIVFVAVEALHAGQGQPRLAARKPWTVAFSFGLLHGFGFAGALQDVGLPEHAIPLALAFFNIGVELGQLAFVAALFALLAIARPIVAQRAGGGRSDPWATTTANARPVAYGIGILAAFWLIQRTASFWNV